MVNPRKPSMELSDVPSAPGALSVVPSLDIHSARAAMGVLMATGAPMGEALGQITLAFGSVAARGLWEAWGPGGRIPVDVITVLDDLAAVSPVLAQVWLLEHLSTYTGGSGECWPTSFFGLDWVKALPAGLSCAGDCILTGTAIQETPPGFEVGGALSVMGCGTFKTFGHGLRVGGSLDLSHCPAWDGRIPADALVGGLVSCDGYLHGITLDEWRERHPVGM